MFLLNINVLLISDFIITLLQILWLFVTFLSSYTTSTLDTVRFCVLHSVSQVTLGTVMFLAVVREAVQ
jgi:hypothetical protein